MNKNYHISIQNIKASNNSNVSPDILKFDLSVYLYDGDANSYSEVESFQPVV